MPTEPGDWRRLAERMDYRRAELMMTWDDVAGTGGISVATLRRVRRGAPVTIDNALAIERGLRWASDSVRRVLAGGEPEARDVATASPSPRRQQESRSFIVGLTRDELVRLADIYAEAFGEQAAEAFLLRAAEIRHAAAEAADQD